MSEFKDKVVVETFTQLRKDFQKGDYTSLLAILVKTPVEILADFLNKEKSDNYPPKEEILVKFEGIDRFNRPIFKSLKTKSRYGSVDVLFNYDSTEKDVLRKVSEKDLLYFGNSFGCEPMGDSVENLIIMRNL